MNNKKYHINLTIANKKYSSKALPIFKTIKNTKHILDLGATNLEISVCTAPYCPECVIYQNQLKNDQK